MPLLLRRQLRPVELRRRPPVVRLARGRGRMHQTQLPEMTPEFTAKLRIDNQN